MHPASNPHDPRFQNSRAPFPIFMLRDIQTVGALVPQTTAVIYSPHMAAKNPNKKRKASLDAILSTVERGFAAVADDITDIKSKIKDDIADVKSTLADHTKILNDHTRDLAIIKKDLTTNLDKRLQLAVRVSAIEKHLGLDKKIAA
jgi:gas vesicle protein